MAVAELQTSIRENLLIVVVVFDDQEIGLIRVKKEIKGLPLHGVQIGGCDWEKIAQGIGVVGVRVVSEHGLEDGLYGALKSGRSTVIDRKTTRQNSSNTTAIRKPTSDWK